MGVESANWGISPYFIKWNEGFLVSGKQFASEVFLGTALMHFLSDSNETFGDLTEKEYPFAFTLASAGGLGSRDEWAEFQGDWLKWWLWQMAIAGQVGSSCVHSPVQEINRNRRFVFRWWAVVTEMGTECASVWAGGFTAGVWQVMGSGRKSRWRVWISLITANGVEELSDWFGVLFEI
ncbi:unnamed protein product [Fraxinus pennsylvanica]|uniref:Uncharacterized protein n=1 Tax=Fraxinus pennsylvanica TaxID=56036 RepID=A0AAD2DPF6_9LAMI|nr:unnamed protein product [Fraxinus pennsylvanica]